jgi:peptidoglycan hydrolase CwlO-like protein
LGAMTNPIEMQRKVRQLDNDVQSIYEMLVSIEGTQVRHLNRLNEIEARADGIDVKVDGIEATQKQHGERLGAIESKVDSLDAKVTGLDTKVTGLDTKVTGLDTKMDSVLDLLRNGGSAAR